MVVFRVSEKNVVLRCVIRPFAMCNTPFCWQRNGMLLTACRPLSLTDAKVRHRGVSLSACGVQKNMPTLTCRHVYLFKML